MARTIAELPKGTRITDYISLGVLATTFPLARVDRIISGEVAVLSGHGTRAMPIWGPVFSQVNRDQDLGRVRIDNLARYLRDIQTK